MQCHDLLSFLGSGVDHRLFNQSAVALVLALIAAVAVLMLLHCGCGHVYMSSHLISHANLCSLKCVILLHEDWHSCVHIAANIRLPLYH